MAAGFEVSIACYINCKSWRRLRAIASWHYARLAILGIVLTLSDCQSLNLRGSGTWKTYYNQRYGFEFLYPSNWIPGPTPSNRDGQAFSNPLQPDVEIRGAAGYDLPEIEVARTKRPPQNLSKVSKQNFTTQQGITGELKIEVGSDFSSMTLRLTQGKVLYSWQGRAPSKQFPDYYRFFYYIASQYRVSSPPKDSERNNFGK